MRKVVILASLLLLFTGVLAQSELIQDEFEDDQGMMLAEDQDEAYDMVYDEDFDELEVTQASNNSTTPAKPKCWSLGKRFYLRSFTRRCCSKRAVIHGTITRYGRRRIVYRCWTPCMRNGRIFRNPYLYVRCCSKRARILPRNIGFECGSF